MRNGKAYRPTPSDGIVGKTDVRGVANLVDIPGSKFLIQLEGIHFDGGRVWKSIDVNSLNDRPIVVSDAIDN